MATLPARQRQAVRLAIELHARQSRLALLVGRLLQRVQHLTCVPQLTANEIDHSIQLIVRTTRGVRCVDLGVPEHTTINDDGTVVGGSVMWWDDCNALPPNFEDMTPDEYDRWSGIIWYTYWGLRPGEYDPDNPPILPESLETIPDSWDRMLVVPRLRLRGPGVEAPEIEVVVQESFRVVDLDDLTGPDT